MNIAIPTATTKTSIQRYILQTPQIKMQSKKKKNPDNPELRNKEMRNRGNKLLNNRVKP